MTERYHEIVTDMHGVGLVTQRDPLGIVDAGFLQAIPFLTTNQQRWASEVGRDPEHHFGKSFAGSLAPSANNRCLLEGHNLIGVGAQSTLGGTTFLPEKYV